MQKILLFLPLALLFSCQKETPSSDTKIVENIAISDDFEENFDSPHEEKPSRPKVVQLPPHP